MKSHKEFSEADYQKMAENPNPPHVEREAFIIQQMRKTRRILDERKKTLNTSGDHEAAEHDC